MNQNAQRALLTQPLPWTAAALCSLLCIILAGPSKFNGGSPSRALGPPSPLSALVSHSLRHRGSVSQCEKSQAAAAPSMHANTRVVKPFGRNGLL